MHLMSQQVILSLEEALFTEDELVRGPAVPVQAVVERAGQRHCSFSAS